MCTRGDFCPICGSVPRFEWDSTRTCSVTCTNINCNANLSGIRLRVSAEDTEEYALNLWNRLVEQVRYDVCNELGRCLYEQLRSKATPLFVSRAVFCLLSSKASEKYCVMPINNSFKLFSKYEIPDGEKVKRSRLYLVRNDDRRVLIFG